MRHLAPRPAALACLAATMLVLMAAEGTLQAQRRGRRRAAAVAQPAPGIYSAPQAARGEALYADNCAYCHLVDLSGGELAPALTGAPFTAKWTSRPLSEVFEYMRVEMPLNSPGGLSAGQNADILAFLLRQSGFPSGAADLPAQLAALKGLRLK